MSDKRPFFTAAILGRRDFSDGSVRVYAGLDTFADADGLAFPTLPRLADRVGKDRRSVQRWLAELEKGGAIARWLGRSAIGDEPARPTVYRLLLSACTTVPAPGSDDGQDPLPGIGEGDVVSPSLDGREGDVVSRRGRRGVPERATQPSPQQTSEQTTEQTSRNKRARRPRNRSNTSPPRCSQRYIYLSATATRGSGPSGPPTRGTQPEASQRRRSPRP